MEKIQGIDVQYVQTPRGHTMALWEQEGVLTFIQAFDGSVIDIREVDTVDDLGHPVTMIVTVVERND